MIIRLLDIILSTIGLILLLPIFIIIAILIYIEDYQSSFYTQKRVGKNRKTFLLYKFRSMTIDINRFSGEVDANVPEQEKRKLRESFITTSSQDKRITKIGKFIRKTSIDELPQLYNVLIGEMSIVGPRPDTPIQELDYEPDQWLKRHLVKPGITGLAQINGRSSATGNERINADIYYAENISTYLYIKIIIITIWQVIRLKGTN